MYYYSKSTGGIYVSSVHSDIPDDAVEVSQEEHEALMAAHRRGCSIGADAQGRPIAIEPTISREFQCARIDSAADAARLAVAGEPLRAAEYQIAEAEAKAYQAAGYVGDCPPSVKSWAEAKGWPSKQAADNIIGEANAWNAALYAIRDARLKAKEAVRNAMTAEDGAAIASAAIAGIEAMVANLGNAAR